jgi:hypothetical protein
MRASTVLVTIGLCAIATTAQAVEMAAEKTSPQSIEVIWAKIGDFCGIAKWHPEIAKCALSPDKHTRTLTLRSGGTIVDHLVKWDDQTRSYTYTNISGPWPVTNYAATIAVQPAKSGSGSVIHMNGHYTLKPGASDAETKKAIDSFYDDGLTALARN